MVDLISQITAGLFSLAVTAAASVHWGYVKAGNLMEMGQIGTKILGIRRRSPSAIVISEKLQA